MPTFKIQGQIYHRAGSLLPVSDSDNKFLQIYFMGNSPQEIDLRCAHNNLVKRSIVEQLQTLFHQHNQLIILFKTALDLMPSDNHKIVIRADKTPAGQHTRRFNAPTIDEVAIVVVGENLESRDIVLHRRNDQLQRIKETHRSYDALQYPIIFWQGEDGYDFSIKMINPITGSETNKKVSSMNYYSYRLMIRENEDNHILKCRRLYHKYVVDMNVKIETERLTFIRLNQTKLRSEEYIHLRDAINTDGNAQNVGRMTILPATYIGSPRHMHEYAQDAMSYVRHYGTADLIITFTCNPQWIEIKQELFPGQSPIDRHDITARVFRQKLKSLMDFIVKHNVFGETRCWMYSVEWQKRGLPHAHILIWLVEKIRPNEVDAVISAEIPNVQVDPGLHELRTVDGELCGSYREACQRLQLLENDAHWDQTLNDAVISSHAHQIRTLFSIIISTCFPSNPIDLWIKYKDYMCDDILYQIRNRMGNPNIQISEEIYNEALISIEDMCLIMSNKLLIQLGLTAPNRPMHDAYNQELHREKLYDLNALKELIQTNLPLLNEQQKYVFETLMKVTNDETGGIYFLDAPGGTGKTFLISLILATIRSQNKIALALASSGIAATLLEGGRTAHSALKLPLNMQSNETPTCNVSKNSAMAKVLQQCKLIVWDECTMAHKKSLEALDRTLKDLRSNNNRFGGAMILLAGDFRQKLPVIPQSTPADELNACLKSSNLWKHVKVLHLSKNMRVELQNDQSGNIFSKQLIDIGNGKFPIDMLTGCINFPQSFCQLTRSKDELIQKVFPDVSQNYKNHDWLSERAILAAKNIDVNELNFKIQEQITGELRIYKSVDSATNQDDVVNYPPEFLNSLDLPGLPPHNLQLKVRSVVIMLRNINQPRLCNGTRLAIKKLLNNVIEATILKGKYKGEDVLIPRIPIIPTDVPFEFKRLQFPVRLAFAMTINKSQGQSLSVCGINLENPCFSHGQLYVACSRVGKPSDLFIYAQ
ncbi:jg5073, partial [Pararge aegeria aegeria]